MDSRTHNEFVRLLETCRLPLLSFIRHSLWNKELLEDAFQAAVLEGWKKFPSFAGDEPGFRFWIFQIADYVIKNLNRAQKETKESRFAGDKETEEQVSPSPSVELLNDGAVNELLLLNNMEDPVKKSVMALTENERNVFLLRSIGDFSYEEISKMLNLPMGSVMGFLARARTKLREDLLDYAREQHNL